MQIIYKGIGELIPYENNPRKNDNAVPYVKESIKRYGFKVPIIIDKNNVIVAGHTRYLASIELGLEELPCIVADDLTEEEIKEFRLVDNKTNEFASWDMELLEIELEGLDFGGVDYNFNVNNSADNIIKEVEIEDTISVVIDCDDEYEAEKIYNKLVKEGYICRILTL